MPRVNRTPRAWHAYQSARTSRRPCSRHAASARCAPRLPWTRKNRGPKAAHTPWHAICDIRCQSEVKNNWVGTHPNVFQTPSSQFPICNIIFFFNPQRASAVVMLDHIGGSIPVFRAAGVSNRSQEARARCVGSRLVSSVSSVQARTKSGQIKHPFGASAGGSFFKPIPQVVLQQRLNDCGQVHVGHCTARAPLRFV